MPRTGRRPGPSNARERIRAAARELFAEGGLEGTSIRAVARRAGVDPALVHHYFGSKERLFVSAMELPIDAEAVIEALLAGGEDGIGERLVRLVLEVWERPETAPVFRGLMRSALTDPGAAAAMRELLTGRGMFTLAEALGRPHPELRATLVGTQILGLALARYLLRIEPLASADPAVVAASVGPTIERYLLDPAAVRATRARSGAA